MKEHTIEFLIVIFTILILAWAFAHAVARGIENQDRMLCESAKISGNVQYLHKCECFYRGESITCIQDK